MCLIHLSRPLFKDIICRPVTLRPSQHTMVYAALVLQALFYIPQIRARVANWRPALPEGTIEVEPPADGPGACDRRCTVVVADSAKNSLCGSLLRHSPTWISQSW